MPCNNLVLLQIAVRPNELKNIPTENIKRICYFSIQLNKTTDIAKMDRDIQGKNVLLFNVFEDILWLSQLTY